MTTALGQRGGRWDAAKTGGEPGWTELCEVLSGLLGGTDSANRVIGLQQLKAKVYRLQLDAGAPWSSVVVKRLEPAVAQRARLVAQRWLPALGLDGGCARLLGAAAHRRGEVVWHVYEDLGDETLAVRPEAERVEAAVQLVARLHAGAARHPVLPDVRRFGGSLGMEDFRTNVRDAIAVLEALRAARIARSPEHAGLLERLLGRLRVLLTEVPRRARLFELAAGPDTLLHGDLWTTNIFVVGTGERRRARFVDWDRVGVGPCSYDLSTFLFRFPAAIRPAILDTYRDAVARHGWRVAEASELEVLFDTAERARYANCVLWPALALLQDGAEWGFPGLAEVERWFQALDEAAPLNHRRPRSRSRTVRRIT